MTKYLLSIYFGYHDSCITIADEHSIVLHLQAERVFGIKKMQTNIEQMIALINIGLKYLKIKIEDVEQVFLAKWNNLFTEIQGKNAIKINEKTFIPILTSHHYNHIGCGFASGFNNALIVCADGGSEDITSAIYLKKGHEVKLIEDLSESILTGRFYGSLTQLVIDPDFSKAHNEYPGKTMGLAAFGKWSSDLYQLILDNASLLGKFHYEGCNELRKIFSISADYTNYTFDWRRINLAFTAQKIWEDEWLKKISEYSDLSDNIILTGGCALNVSLNSKILDNGLFHRVYIPPVCNDTGQSLGALLYHYPQLECRYPFLGRGFGEVEEVPLQLVDDLLNHRIVCWYQGRSEIGPRALGHRSILGLPDSVNMRRKISEQIKKREFYRPVAPIIPESDAKKFFDIEQVSPYMTIAAKVKDIVWDIAPAIIHVDGTSRVQTLAEDLNPVLHKILKAIGESTGVPILMNTSFNTAGSPIVDTPEDALKTFKITNAEVIYINGKRWERADI
jgi:carbamoyltransferase